MNQKARTVRAEKQYQHCITFSKGLADLATSVTALLEHSVGGGILMRKARELGAMSYSGDTSSTRKWAAVDDCVLWRVLAIFALDVLCCLKS